VIYLDHNASTPLAPAVAAAMGHWLGPRQANPSSSHSAGQAARAAVEEARSQVAALVGARPGEVILTGSGSEADVLALVGVALSRRPTARRVVVSAIEHEAVLEAAELLGELGFTVVRVPPRADGQVDAETFIAAVEEGTAVASLILASNETGVLQPVAAVARTLRKRGIPFHTDAVQAMGRIPVSFEMLGVDLLSLSGHKFGGPQGAGALVVRQGMRLQPLVGGAQESGRRGGTEAVAAIVGLGAAAAGVPARLAAMPAVRTRLDRLAAGLLARIPGAQVHGASAARLPNTLSIAFPGADAAALVLALDLAGVAASRGSACASGAEEPSHVLRAMGMEEAMSRGTIRLSLGVETTDDEIERVIEIIAPAVERARGAAVAGARGSAGSVGSAGPARSRA
jgi:cysteine desulfurase